MSNFAESLQQQLESTPHLRRRGQKILEVLKSPRSARKDRIIRRLERHATAALDEKVVAKAGGVEGIDWSKIDWQKFLSQILELLLKLLPLILGGL